MNYCKILGYSKYVEKETGEPKLRVLIGIDSISENYKGIMVAPPIFLDFSNQLIELLNKALEEKLKVEYVTKENIITGKTKIIQLKIDNNLNNILENLEN